MVKIDEILLTSRVRVRVRVSVRNVSSAELDAFFFFFKTGLALSCISPS